MFIYQVKVALIEHQVYNKSIVNTANKPRYINVSRQRLLIM